jgi:hypothetical protein
MEPGRQGRLRRCARAGASLFLIFFIFGIYTAIPTPDQSYRQPTVKNKKVEHLLYSIILLHPPAEPNAATAAESAPAPLVSATDLSEHSSTSLHDRLWRFLILRERISKGDLLARKLAFRLYIAYCVLAYPIASQNWIAIPFLILCLLFFVRRRQVYLLWGFSSLTLFCALLLAGPHHVGLVWIALLATLWIALATRPAPETPQWLSMALFIAILVVIAGQIRWTFHAVRMDYLSNYDGSKMVADYISRLPGHEQVAAFTHHTTAIQPYFSHNRFFNEPTTYWMWSKANDPDKNFAQILGRHPAMVVIAESRSGDENVENQLMHLQRDWVLEAPTIDLRALADYSPVASFCGQLYIRLGSEDQICYRLFVPTASGTAPPAQRNLN